MTESKPPSSNRMIRPGLVSAAPAAALGHNYSATGPFQLISSPRPKLNQTAQTSGNATSVSPLVTSTVTQFHVTVPLGGSAKEPLRVTKVPATSRQYPIEKLTVPLSVAAEDSHVKANVKNMGIQKVNYVKQITTTNAKPHGSSPLMANIVPGQIKKEEIIKPVLVGAGLRQPLKPHHSTTKTSVYGLPRTAAVHPSSWALNQPDISKASSSNAAAAIARTKAPFQTIAAPHDLSKKHSITQQPKSTISITPTGHIPISGHRNAALTVAPLTTGSKPIYQVVTPDFPAGPLANNTIKKIPAMIVNQAISLPLSNSGTTTAGFISPSSALSTGQITVMTCGASVRAPTPPNGTNSAPIPIAKVYPQQQSAARSSVPSSTSNRLSVPVISSVSASTSISRATSAMIQVGPIKSTPTTSIVMTTQTTIMSTIPVAVNKTVSNSSGIGSVLCWPASFSQALPVSSVTSTANLRPTLSLSSTLPPSQPAIQVPGAVRLQQHSVMLVEAKTTHLQATAGSAPSVLQVTDNRAAAPGHNTNNQTGAAPGTPTMSPKPTILRRQRHENSSALKKIDFSASNFATQRRDLHTKPAERRPTPYPLNRPKLVSNSGDVKPEMPVVIHAASLGDKSEMKPVLENQVFQKQQLPGGNLQQHIGNNLKPQISPFSNSAKDGGNHSYSVHPVVESKAEGYSAQQNSVKSEPASASQMLQLQNQTMHTYAAESPQAVSNVQHRIISHASGHHITTNTIFTKPGAHSIYPGHLGPRPKAPPVIKAVANLVPHSQSDSTRAGSHGVNSFPSHRAPNFITDRSAPTFEFIKKEPQRLKAMPVIEHMKSVDGINQLQNHGLPNHGLPVASPAKSWTNANSLDSMAGLSPRKRPRKQTHIVSEDQPVVMEDEESTDDADECEDEPMPEATSQHPNISTTPAAKLPGHKTSSTQRSNKSDGIKKVIKEENIHKYSHAKSEPLSLTSADMKPPSEFTDRNGVRYVVNRKRPAVSVLNRLKPNSRSVANHFMHYSDIRVKDKKITIGDLASDKRRLKGIKVARLALQLRDMVDCEKDVWDRMQAVHDGLVEYKSSLLGDVTFDSAMVSPSPGTPSSLSNSFRKATPRSSRSGSFSAARENGTMQSPSTPLDRKASKVKDEIANIEELAQANLQRCRVVSEQLTDTKNMLLKSVDHRQLVTDILESSSNPKSQVPANSQTTKRLPKKKTNS